MEDIYNDEKVTVTSIVMSRMKVIPKTLEKSLKYLELYDSLKRMGKATLHFAAKMTSRLLQQL